MNIEALQKKMEKLELLAARERLACERSLRGARPSGAKLARRIRMLTGPTKAIAISERTVQVHAGEEPQIIREVLHFTRAGHAGHCTAEAISARKAYEQAASEA